MSITFDRIKELAKKQGLSINSLEEKLGYSRNTLYSLKKQNASTDRMQEIADYLNVSLDYLLGRTD
uniref:helix-turn-helix domain-containing protein n=2 Tax=Streptococcus TaxID=1301 RepID=UPI0012905395